MWTKVKQLLNVINPLDIFTLTKRIDNNVKYLVSLQESKIACVKNLEYKLRELRVKREKEHNMFLTTINHLEDLVWAKDLDGKYLMCNTAFREKFCYGFSWDSIKGKTDIELAKMFKELVGSENHTFGEVCANSDIIIHETQEAREFLEHGLINGKLVKLVVNKSPVFNHEGLMFATCGTGRDVTEWHSDLEKAIDKVCGGCGISEQASESIIKELNKLEFKEGDHVK